MIRADTSNKQRSYFCSKFKLGGVHVRQVPGLPAQPLSTSLSSTRSQRLPAQVSSLIVRGSAWHRGSILASNPAAPGLNPGSAVIFSLYWLVCEQY